jgi:hypothetical protein
MMQDPTLTSAQGRQTGTNKPTQTQLHKVFHVGQFKLHCPDLPVIGVDNVLNKDDCGSGCNGQLLVAADCREAFFCYEPIWPDGGKRMTCPQGQASLNNFVP